MPSAVGRRPSAVGRRRRRSGGERSRRAVWTRAAQPDVSEPVRRARGRPAPVNRQLPPARRPFFFLGATVRRTGFFWSPANNRVVVDSRSVNYATRPRCDRYEITIFC